MWTTILKLLGKFNPLTKQYDQINAVLSVLGHQTLGQMAVAALEASELQAVEYNAQIQTQEGVQDRALSAYEEALRIAEEVFNAASNPADAAILQAEAGLETLKANIALIKNLAK